MLNLKRNIWLLFYIIVFIGSILLAIAIYDKYQQIVKESKNAQRYLTQVDQKHLNVLFTYHETIQSLIADEYINDPNFASKKFNTLYKLNPLLLDIWVFSKEGELLRATLPGVSFPNMLKNENTRKWFQEALNSNEMVIGKPYLLQCIDKWILPIRKRVLDNNGNIVAVISTALDLSKLQDQWKKEDNQGNTIRVILSHGGFLVVDSDIKVQDAPDHYEQAYKPVYFTHKSSTYKKYSSPVRALAKQINGSLTKNVNSKSVIQGSDLLDSGLQDSDLQNVHTTPSYLDKGISSEIFYTRSHNARYHFAITAEIPYYRLYQKLFTESLFASVFYLLLIIVVFMLFRWIDKIEKYNVAELIYKAGHDELTGLANYREISKYFSKIQMHKETPFALLYLTLDNFKNINKAFGHCYGQQIIIETAKRIVQSLSTCNALVTRYSGDEFVILIESDNKPEITGSVQVLLKNIAQSYLIDKNGFKVSASIGIACFPKDSLEIETLLSYANSSIAMAKKGANHYQFFSPSDHQRFTRNITIEQALRSAIKNKEISLVYQPQLDKMQNLFGVEALVRWNSKELGFVAPDEFIAIAEKNGYMPQLGLYIMHRAMEDIAHLKKQQQVAFQLSINVSAKQFIQDDFNRQLIVACKFHGIDPATITIEITENLFIEGLDKLLPLFLEIKKHHISLSLDDFGTGYSSLSMLRKVPIDELKIDKSFVDHITTNSMGRAMVKNIISMGKELGISVLAEGVETIGQVEILENSGCDLFQGYYFSKPLTLENLAVFAKQHNATEAKQVVLQVV